MLVFLFWWTSSKIVYLGRPYIEVGFTSAYSKSEIVKWLNASEVTQLLSYLCMCGIYLDKGTTIRKYRKLNSVYGSTGSIQTHTPE